MNRSQILSAIVSAAFFGMLIIWTPVSGEEVIGQEQDISLYLYSDNGIGKLHTMETGNHGDTDQVNIQPGSSIFFALNLTEVILDFIFICMLIQQIGMQPT